MESELDWIRCFRDGMDELKTNELLTSNEFVEQLEPFLDAFRTTSRDLKRLKRQQRIIEDDMEEQMEVKRHRVQGPDEGFLERAYSSTIVARVMSATGKQRARKFDQSRFRREVTDYYGAHDPDVPGYVWCHVLAEYLPSTSIKAAHLVPKSLSGEEISHLFGVGELVLYDPRNGITLALTVESRLDQGSIVIVPMPGESEVPTRWRCVVLDESKRKEIIWAGPVGPNRVLTKLEDLDGKELEFKTDNRPARRYLYFRFIISYLNAKRAGNSSVDDKVNKSNSWPTLGRYLNKSTLVTLARCVSVCDLPAFLVDGKTFDSENADDIIEAQDAGMTLSAGLRDALIESMKEAEAEDQEGEEESDE